MLDSLSPHLTCFHVLAAETPDLQSACFLPPTDQHPLTTKYQCNSKNIVSEKYIRMPVLHGKKPQCVLFNICGLKTEILTPQ